MEEIPPGQTEARIAELEHRVNELEQIVAAATLLPGTSPARERLTP